MKATLSSAAAMLLAGVILFATARDGFGADTNSALPPPKRVFESAVRYTMRKADANLVPKYLAGEVKLLEAMPSAQVTGEQFCWNAAYGMGEYLRGYEVSHDTVWLDYGVKYYDYCIDRLAAGPDGYKGWVGPDGGEGAQWNDRHVGQAVMLDRILEFSELVLKDGELAKKYGEAAKRYVGIARKDLIEKWDKRGTWREDGEYGAYVDWANSTTAAKPTEWTTPTTPGLTLPFNKQNDLGQCLLKLYRITREESYLQKARKIYAHMRSRFQYVADKDYYVWNYWEPFGPWDVDIDKKVTRHWMNVHGYRNYQAGEIGQIVEAYHTGIVFTKLDIERIINTNLKVMWNGDKAGPKWVNSNALLPNPPMTEEEKKKMEAEIAANPYAKEGRAGCLWTALVDFDQTVRDLEALRFQDAKADSIGKAYFENVTLKTPVSFDRRYAKDAQVEQVPVTNCKSLTVATVMPHVLGKTPSVVLCKSRIDNDLEVAVFSADGKRKIGVLYKGKIQGGTDGLAGIHVFTWDGSDPQFQKATLPKPKLAKGDYLVRWTVADGCREYKVTVPE